MGKTQRSLKLIELSDHVSLKLTNYSVNWMDMSCSHQSLSLYSYSNVKSAVEVNQFLAACVVKTIKRGVHKMFCPTPAATGTSGLYAACFLSKLGILRSNESSYLYLSDHFDYDVLKDYEPQ